MKKRLCLIVALAMLICLTACGAKPDDTENGTTATTVTTTPPSDTDTDTADLFFPVHNTALKAPEKATMQEVSINFVQAQKRVRIQLPETMTVQVVEQGAKTYAAIYCGDLRIGRLVPNFVFPDSINSEVEGDLDVDGCTIQRFSYTAGTSTAYTYSGFTMPDDIFFYVLEISADYISAADLATCLRSIQSIQLLERNNRLDCRGKEPLRIAIAGNSFIGYSHVVQQLQAMLNANGKNVTVDEHWYPNITITDFAYDAEKMEMLCGGDYDLLFINGAYTTEDANNLPVLERACIASGTELVLFAAHNEDISNTEWAYHNSQVKLAHWRVAVENLIEAGVPESDLIWYDGPRHSKELAGYCGAVMIYGMLYETAPNTAAIGAQYSGLSVETAQLAEDVTMEYIRPYWE